MLQDDKKTKEQLTKELVELQHQYDELKSELIQKRKTEPTESKQVADSCRKNEGKYCTLFETMEQGVVYQNASGEIISANPAAERILGLTIEQMQGRKSIDSRWKAVHEDGSDFPGETHPSMVALRTGKVVSAVTMGVFNPKTETYSWILINAVPQFKAGKDKPHQCFTTFTDITVRKQMEQEVYQQIKRLQKVSELSMTLTGDPNSVFNCIVMMIAELLDVKVVCLSEIRGDELYFISVYIDGKVITEAGHCPLNITPCATVEHTKDLRVYNNVTEMFPEASFLNDHNAYSYCGFPSLDNNGNVVAVTCLLDDKEHAFNKADRDLLRIFGQRIAVELELETQLAVSRGSEKSIRDLAQIVETSLNEIYIFDAETLRFIQVNSGARLNTGYTQDEFIELTPVDLKPEYTIKSFEQTIEPLKNGTKDIVKIETNHRRKDGSLYFVEVIIQLSSFGGKSAFVAIVLDIEERKQADSLKQIQSELAQNLNTETDLSRAAMLCLNAAIDGTNMDSGGIYLVNEATGDIELEYSKGLSAHFIKEVKNYSADSPNTRIVKAGRPVYIQHSELKVAKSEVQRNEGLRVLAIFPIKHDGKVFACMNLTSRTLDEISLSEKNVLQAIAAQLSQTLTRLKAQESLKESEERLSKFINSAENSYHILDPDLKILEINQKALEAIYLALPSIKCKQDVVGKDFEHFYPFLTDEIPKLKEVIKTSESYTNELTVPHPKLGDLVIKSVCFKVGDGLGIIAENVTERRRAKDALKESEERFRSYISHAPFALLIVDKQGRFVDSNEAASYLTGYTQVELLKMTIPDLADSELKTQASRKFLQAKETGQLKTEISLKRKDGSIVWASLDAVSLSDGRLMAFCSDITETKRLRELESRAQRLETAGQIAGQVAHDFNNLLAPMMAYPEFIREKLPKNHGSLKYLDQIEKAAIKIADINQDLLTMGRRGHYNQEVLNLNTVIQHVISEFNTHSETLAFELNLDEDLMGIFGGGAQLHRMISNLLHNAKDAMLEIGRVSVRTENYYVDEISVVYGRVPKGEYVKLTITDTGCGIPENIVQKIFDPFFTSKTADKKRGSGLGMSVVDSVIRDHCGFIDLSSKVGEGTSFYIYFPISRESLDHRDSDEICAGSESILIVDDDEIQREVSLQLLMKLGYEVSTAESGEKAIDLLQENPMDLVILDMVMPPGIDGTETYRQMLKINPKQKAIILSGFSDSDRVLEAQKLGAGAFVKKPVTKQMIASAVRKELNKNVRTMA